MHKLTLFVGWISLAASHLGAQACDVTNAPDSLPASLMAYFTPVAAQDSVPLADDDSLVTQLRAMLHVPDPVPIPAWTPSVGWTVPTLHGAYELRIDRDGMVRDVRIARSSLVGSVDSVVVAALRTAVLPPRNERSRLVLRVFLQAPSTPVPVNVDTTKHLSRKNGTTLVAFTHKVPAWPEEKLPPLLWMRSAPPSAARIHGIVVVDAVVDEKGHVIRGSVYHSQPPVSEAVFDVAREVAESYQFKPFTINDCAVKMWRLMPIPFAGR